MISDMISNKKLHSVANELIIRSKKLSIFSVLHTKSYFWAPNDVRLNTTPFFTTKISNSWELQQLSINHSTDTEFNVFKRSYRKFTAEPHSLLVIDATLPSDNSLRSWKIYWSQHSVIIQSAKSEMVDCSATLIEQMQIYQHHHHVR